MSLLDGITGSVDMSLSKPLESVIDREACYAAVHGFTKNRTWLSEWTELKHLAAMAIQNTIIFIIGFNCQIINMSVYLFIYL